MRAPDRESIGVDSISLAVPTLDDVFLKKTGRTLRDTEAAQGDRR